MASEFGKGYAYCLGLFLAHESRIQHYMEINKKIGSDTMNASAWFNGAADHLYELEIPAVLPEEKKKQIDEFQKRCLTFRLCMNGEKCGWEEAAAAISEAKDLLREWDVFHNIPSEKGSWE